MCEVSTNMEDNMCTGCLSTGRKLFFIGETGFYHLYSQILNEIPVYDMSAVSVRVCWECIARLRGMHLFKQQVQQNYSDLMQHIPPQARSSLSTHSQQVLSFPDVKCESDELVELQIKCETAEHCEPEPFASALDVKQSEEAEENVEPLQKKKKLKIKLKTSSKIKVKKTRKKRSIDKLTESNIGEIADNIEDDDDPMDDNVENIDIEDNIEESNLNENILKEHTKVTREKTLPQVLVKLPVDVLVKPIVVKRGRDMTPLPARPQCQECGKVFSSKKTYRYHLNVLHRGQNQYPCPRCGKVYQWKSNLGRHMRTHKAVDDGELHCTLCDKSFASVATYRQHLRISRRHVPETDFSFACDDCGKRFVNKTRLRDHVDWDHLNRIKFRCSLCDKPFKCHTSLYVHTQNVHVGKERKDNLCHVCGKSYQNAAKLKYHITAMHSGETPYRCAACGAAFGWYSSLYRHMREVHYKMKGETKKGKKLKPRAPPAAPAPPSHYASL